LYAPKTIAVQVVLLFVAFLGGPALGWLSGFPVDGKSSGGELFLYVPPTLVFFL
jgi:hypothetical protein